jgi:hypothetical protein
MSKFREAPCIYYNAHNDCIKGVKNAEYKGKCQHCEKYEPRKGYKSESNYRRKKKMEAWVE